MYYRPRFWLSFSWMILTMICLQRCLFLLIFRFPLFRSGSKQKIREGEKPPKPVFRRRRPRRNWRCAHKRLLLCGLTLFRLSFINSLLEDARRSSLPWRSEENILRFFLTFRPSKICFLLFHILMLVIYKFAFIFCFIFLRLELFSKINK